MSRESSMPRTIFLLSLALIVAVGMFLLAINSPDWSLVVPQGSGNNINGEHELHDDLNQDIEESLHATNRHSEGAEAVRTCFDKFGSVHIFFNPKTNRYLQVCFMNDTKWGNYGVRITEAIDNKMKEITAFPKEKFTTWKQMSRYIENGGYTNQVK